VVKSKNHLQRMNARRFCTRPGGLFPEVTYGQLTKEQLTYLRRLLIAIT